MMDGWAFMMDAEAEQDCLMHDPFEGDETDVSRLKDKFVVTRKPHYCAICLDHIASGARVRAKTERNNEEGKIMTFYFCEPCCEAMAKLVSDDDMDAMDARYAVAYAKSKNAA